MEPQECQSALNALRNGMRDHHTVVVVEDAKLRPFVRQLIDLEFPSIPVLSHRELRTDLKFEALEAIEPEDGASAAELEFRKPAGTVAADGPRDGREKDVAECPEVGITVFINEAAAKQRHNADNEPIENLFSLMREGLFYELGIILPEVNLDFTDKALPSSAFRFSLNGRQSRVFEGLVADEFLVNDTPDRLRLLDINGSPALNPANGNQCAIIKEGAAEGLELKKCKAAGLSTWGQAGFLVLTLAAEIRRIAASFQTISATAYMIDSLEASFPDLVRATLKRFSAEQLCLVLKDLLDEEISIRNMRSILEGLLSINGTTDVNISRYVVLTAPTDNLCPVSGSRTLADLTTGDYSDFIRSWLKRYISNKYTRGSNTLVVYLLDPVIERRIGAAGAVLTVEEKTNLKAAVEREVGSLPPTSQYPVLLTSADVRRALRKLIEPDFPNLAVLSYQELSPDLSIQPIGRITWD
jgi:type III secretion protein V